MNIKRWATSFVALLCLLCLPVSLFAGCKGNRGKIEVVFDMNWKEAASAPASIHVKEGEPYGQLPEIADDIREGYTFGGWYLDSDCDGEEVTAETVVTSSVSHVLYAKWIGNKITVSFDLQGGTINGVSNVEDAVVTVGNVYSMMAIPEDPEKENHSFMGWYYDPEGTEGPVRTSTKVEKIEDHTLYAVWQEYQLFYNFENGTGLEVFAAAGNIQYGIEHYNGSDQLNISNPGTDKADGTALQMWIPLKTGTRVTMDLTFAGELPSEDARMYMFGYGMNASGIAITDGLLDINESETHRRWYHGTGYRAMQKDGVWYYGDEGNWHEGNTCKFEMIVMEDCAGLYLTFSLGSELEPAQFAKNDIYIDNIEFTPNYYRVLGEGMMGSSPHGATDNGIYFTMKDNGLPYGDWDVYYGATTADNIKLIRNGKVYRVAEIGCDNICKFSATDYYLRLENYTIGAAAPISTKDMFIVEGNFAYGNNILTIKKAYIYHDGTSWVVVDQLPAELAPASEQASNFPDPYYGILRSHEGGAAEGGIHFRLSDNGLPYGEDWSVYYDATTPNNIKLIRDGKAYAVAQVGCDNICKFGKDSYYLRLESYTIGGFAPYTTKDIIIVEGDFVYEDSTLSINKTYIYYNGSEWVFTTKLPAELAPESEEPVTPEELPEGVMGMGLGATDTGIYFTMKDNDLPYGDWNVYYDATTEENIKVIRDGKVYAVAGIDCDNICKFTATDYYLRLESYTIGDFAPFTNEDIFIVEGDFTYEDSTLTIKKTYIYFDGTVWVFATELPEELKPETEEPAAPEVTNDGVMSSSPNGATENGIYFTMKDNGLPFGDWDVYYSATTANNIKIIREGKVYAAAVAGCDNICKFSKTDYYLRLESYTIGGYAPISTKDIFIVEGDFTYEDSTLSLNKTYIYHDGSAWVFATKLPEELKPETEKPVAPEVTNDGVMSSSPNGATENGIYFTMKDNGLPFGDWDVYYSATTANNIKIIREGKVYAAAVVGCDNICKFSATDYYLRLENYTIGGYAPISTKDIFIVEGKFTYENSTLKINKTYIYHDGSAWVFATKLPEELKPETEKPVAPEVTNDGVMSSSPNGATENGIYFTMKDNGLPFGDWDVYYSATTANNIKIIRQGKVYAAAAVGCDNICKFSATDYYLRLESYTIGSYAPFTTKDIIIVEGNFIYEDSTLSINKTYIYYNGSEWVFTTKLPAELAPDTEEIAPDPLAGILRAHEAGATEGGIYFRLSDNGLPFGDWDVYYDATTADNIKIIRNDRVYSAAQVGCDNICKFSKDEYYLRLESYTIGGYAPFTTKDIIIVEGDFVYEDSTLSIDKTYIYHNGSEWVFTTELPEDLQPGTGGGEEPGNNQLGVLSNHAGGVNIDGGTVKGIYATGAATNATFNTDWSVEYTPAAAENYKLIRDGITYNVGVPGNGTIVMFGQTELYLKQEGHTFGDGTLLPIREGDILVVEGQWNCNQDADSTFEITTTYILIENNTATFHDTYPGSGEEPGGGDEEPGTNELGVLSAHYGGVNMDGATNAITGIYATGATTNATYNTDWTVEYTPASAENYKLIRDGVTYNVGVPGSGTIVLFGQTELYLKQEGHTFGDGTLLPIREGDILVVTGEWICNQDENVVIQITNTCILIGDGTVTFYAGEEDEEEGGEGTEIEGGLSAHEYGVNIDTATNSVKGIYAICKENNATFNTDWSVEYTPAAAENYKLIRDGVTYNVGVPGNGTIVLFGQTELYLKQEGHTIGDGTLLPIRDGDILVVEGQWNCIQDASSTLTVDTTYILISGNTAVFSGENPAPALPDEDEPTDVQWPFNFDDGQVSTDIFKLRDSDLNMTVEELGGSMQLRLQPTVTNGKYWLWLNQDLQAGTVITLDVTFQRKLGSMNLYLYGADENGDPITEGTVSDAVPQIWFDGQGVAADFTGGNTNTQTVTFTVYEDCHGIAFMLGYGNKKPNVIYLDNITMQNGSAEGENALGVLSDHYGGANIDTQTNSVKGIYATVAATGAIFNTDWSVEYTPTAAGNYKLIRDGITYDVGVPGNGTIVLFGQTELYLKQEAHTVGDGTLLPIRDGDILVVEGRWNCLQNNASAFTISKTYILIEGGTVRFSTEQP